MKVIPVMDILSGVVVHAIRGERKKYEPIKSVICDSSKPLEVAIAFKEFGFNRIYVADLDSIIRKGNNYETIRKISKITGLELMVDGGISDFKSAKEIFNYNISSLIIGTETLTSLDFVRSCIKKFGADKIIVSIDTKEGKMLGSSSEINLKNPAEIASIFENMGIEKIIILDLARVGSKQGINWPLLNEIANKTNVKVIIGGGVRNLNDIVKLDKKGIYGVLIATVIHDGSIKKEDIKIFQSVQEPRKLHK